MIAAPLAAAKRKIYFSDAIEAVKKPTVTKASPAKLMDVPSSPTKHTTSAAKAAGVRFLDVPSSKKSVKSKCSRIMYESLSIVVR